MDSAVRRHLHQVWIPFRKTQTGLNQCWGRMLVTKCAGENFQLLVTILAILDTKIHYLFTLELVTNIQKVSPSSKYCHQLAKNVTISSHQHHAYSLTIRFEVRVVIL